MSSTILPGHTGPRAIHLADYRPPTYRVEHIDLHFELDADTTEVRTKLWLRRHPEQASHPAPLVLNGCQLELIALSLDGERVSPDAYTVDDESLTLHDVPETAARNGFELAIHTRIHPGANTALEGLYASSDMLCTQCEAQGFRRITYFPDRPDVMAIYTITLVADRERYPVLLSNGNPIEQRELGNGRHLARWHDPCPKPSYLFALVAGRLAHTEDHFTTASGRDVQLRIYVDEQHLGQCAHAMTSLKQAMRWDELSYDREYDLDVFNIVAVGDFNMGAMENKGLNIFNSACVLASPETATDADHASVQGIIGHEYFHNWSGNRVTCRDWFQLSLKEGFTVFRDQQFSADMNSAAVKRIQDVDILRTHQFAQDAGPMAHPVRPTHYIEISNFYTVTVYNKGAEVVRMLYQLLGPSGFRHGTDLYFTRHDAQAVTTDDFVCAMEDANAIDLGQFRRWYEQAGTPVVHVSDDYNAATRCYTLHLRQSCPPTPGQTDKQPFHIPIAMALLDPEGKPVPLRLDTEETATGNERVLALSATEQHFCFQDVAQPPIPSLLRGFSAPVKLDLPRDDATLAFLLAHETDAFNRWDAGQQLALNTLLRLIPRWQAGATLELDSTVIEAYRRALTDADPRGDTDQYTAANPITDPALVAQILTLPGESYLADQCASVDVDAIHAVRVFMHQHLAMALHDELLHTYSMCQNSGPYRFTPGDSARRALKNLCLSYLMEEQDTTASRTLCMTQFEQAGNMTDALGALSALVQQASPERETALHDFYVRWQHDAQVVDKWFALQAGSRLPDTLVRVQTLMHHPAFRLTNPNKVRALIGRFCMGNPVRFHAADGSGYAFLAQQVLALNSLNPQGAARLCGALSRWQRYDSERGAFMRAQLQRIRDHEGLSRDVFEIVDKSLGEA